MTDRDADPGRGFREWAQHAHGSPLYRHLAEQVAEDQEVLDIAAEFARGPRQNLLFATVHALLRPDDRLAEWYPSLHDDARTPDADTYPAFRAFVLDHRDALLELGDSRYVQTNEPRRCGVLLPYVVDEAERLGEPVHLIEIGAAAGLNLCMDRYAYAYGSGRAFGTASLVLEVEDRGAVPVPNRPPWVQHRVGIDLHPLDVNNPSDAAWLNALVWPEQDDRRQRLNAAMGIRRMTQIETVPGDASRLLSGVARQLPTSGPVVIFHSFTLNQFSPDQTAALDEALADIARRRSVTRIGWEYWERDLAWPEVRVGFGDHVRTVARAHPHGDWVEAA